eukprot:gene23122-30323_t
MSFVGAVGTSYTAGDDEFRVGTVRPSMKTNPLLTKAELGQVKRTTFSRTDPEHVFGYMPPKDPEGVREVTGIWKESPGPSGGSHGQTSGQPQSDFKQMNKLAAISGMTSAKDQPGFRAANPATVTKRTETTLKKGVTLPSDKNVKHTYGLPSSHRTAETIREKGPVEVPLKHLVQGAYADEWAVQNSHMVDGKTTAAYIPPVPTRAALGHAIGAQKYLQHGDHGEEWKMSKFKKVGSRVTQYMGEGGTRSMNRSGGAPEQAYQQEEATEEQ